MKIKKNDINSIFPIIIKIIKLIFEDVNRFAKLKFCKLYISEFTVLVKANIANLKDCSKPITSKTKKLDKIKKIDTIDAYDINKKNLKILKKIKKFNNFYLELKKSNSKYDLIILSHSIFHITKLHESFATISKLLKKDGHILFKIMHL